MSDDQLVEAAPLPTDAELFANATAPEPKEAPAADDLADLEPVSRETEQPRSPDGKWAAKVAEPAPEPTAPATPPTDDAKDGQPPAWRLREEAENRRRAETERDDWRRKFEEAQRNPPQPVEQPKPEVKPDPLMDPEGYEAYVLKKVEDKLTARDQQRAAERGNESMLAAKAADPATFDKAYAEIQSAGNALDIARIKQARDPGKELIAWFTEREIVRDPVGYAERKNEERLQNDLAYRAKVIGILRGQAPTANGNAAPEARQPSPVQLPPSLSRVTPAGANRGNPDDDDTSEEGLFSYATAGMR